MVSSHSRLVSDHSRLVSDHRTAGKVRLGREYARSEPGGPRRFREGLTIAIGMNLADTIMAT
jgi:hypothetical protein